METLPPDPAWKVVRDKSVKMSTRITYFAVYAYLRSCEIIDYWFPV